MIVRNPGGRHTQAREGYAALQDSVRNYACRVSLLDETGFYAPSMAHTPCPAVPGWAFLCFVGIISTVSRQLRYSPPEPVCACRLGSSRCGSIYLLVALPTAIAVGSLCACSLFFYAFPRLLPWARSVRARYSFTLSLGCCRGLALCVLVICVCFSRSPPGSLGFARSL